MRKSFEWYRRDVLCSRIEYEGEWPHAVLLNAEHYDARRIHWAIRQDTSEALNKLFEERVQPRHLFNDMSRSFYGVDHYHAEEMCRSTHAVMPHDGFWMKFSDEDQSICWDDVRLK